MPASGEPPTSLEDHPGNLPWNSVERISARPGMTLSTVSPRQRLLSALLWPCSAWNGWKWVSRLTSSNVVPPSRAFPMVAMTKNPSSRYMTRSIQLDRGLRTILDDPILGSALDYLRSFHRLL